MDSNNEEFDNDVYIVEFSRNSSIQDDIDEISRHISTLER